MRPPAARRRGLLPVLLTGQVLVNVDLTIVNVAVPSIRTGLSAGDGEISLVVSGYALVYATLLIAGARLGDVHGHARVFRIGTALFTAASALCGVAPDGVTLVAARVVQGAGAALLVPQVLSIVQIRFDGPARARALGRYGVALSAGAVAGQALGAVLVSADPFGIGWRSVFLVNLPLGLALLALSVRCLPADGPGVPRSPDVVGILLLSGALLLALVPLTFGRELGLPWWAALCLVLSVPAGRLFVLQQRRRAAGGREPLMDPVLVARPAVRWGLVAHGSSTLVCLSALFVLSVYLQTGLGRDAAEAGFASIGLVAAFGLSGFLVERMPPGIGRRLPVGACLLVAVACAALAGSALRGGTSGPLFPAVLAVLGLGLGLSSVSLIGVVTAVAAGDRAGDLSGLINANAQLWGALGVAGTSAVYLGLAPRAAPQAFAVVAACFAVVSVGSGLAARRATAVPRSGGPGRRRPGPGHRGVRRPPGRRP